MSVDHESVRFHGGCRVVQCVRVLCRLALQLALVAQRSGSTITEESIVPDELDNMARMTSLDAIYADGITVGGVACSAPVEVVHGKTGVTGNFVETLTARHHLLHHVVVVVNRVIFYNGIYSTGKAETSKLVVEDLVSLESCCGIVRDFHAGRQSVEDSVAAEDGIALVADEDTCLSVAENVVLLEDSSPSVKDADASVSPVVDLVVSKGGIAVRFYPNPCHGIVEDFVVLDDS